MPVHYKKFKKGSEKYKKAYKEHLKLAAAKARKRNKKK